MCKERWIHTSGLSEVSMVIRKLRHSTQQAPMAAIVLISHAAISFRPSVSGPVAGNFTIFLNGD